MRTLRHFISLIIALILISGGKVIGQHLTFVTTGYAVNYSYFEGYSQVFVTCNYDSQGRRSGEIIIRKKRTYKDTAVVFRGNFEKGILVDTAYWYRDFGGISRKVVFGRNASTSDRIPFTEFKGFCLAGKPEGPAYYYDSYHSSQVLVKKELYRDGKLNGVTTSYYYNGAVHEEVNYVNDQLQGKYKCWTDDHILISQGENSNGFKEGKWSFYDLDKGNLERISTYRHGEESDTTFYFGANGKITYMMCMSHGVRCGDWLAFDTTGNKSLYRHYDQYGSMDSVEISYYSNGKKEYEAHYADGGQNGRYTSWYANGKLDSTGMLSYGSMIGKWLYYDRNGNLKKVVKHQDEIPVDVGQIGVMDQEGEDYYVPSIIEVMPKIVSLEKELVATKKDKLKFLRHYPVVELDAFIDPRGNVKWKVITPMAYEERKLLMDYMNANCSTGSCMHINGGYYLSTMHIRLYITK